MNSGAKSVRMMSWLNGVVDGKALGFVLGYACRSSSRVDGWSSVDDSDVTSK